MAIIHEPGPPPELRRAIERAIDTNQELLLERGVHLTNRSSSEDISEPIIVGGNGLRIRRNASPFAGRPVITRPDDGLTGDDQYGLFFVPEGPSLEEIASAQWKRDIRGAQLGGWSEGTPTYGEGEEFEYDILVRGDIVIHGVDLDCNIPDGADERWGHSAMLGFAGKAYRMTEPAPDGVPRMMFVAFRLVHISDMKTVRGGTADDIWIARGYFHPNVESVVLESIRSRSVDRVNQKRSTISFSELAANITMSDCDVVSIHVEDDERVTWDEKPRQKPEFRKAEMILRNVRTEHFSLNANGYVINLDAVNLTTLEGFKVERVTGSVRNSKLHKGSEAGLKRLDMQFDNVSWVFKAEHGRVAGVKPLPQHGEPCRITFRNNSFSVDGGLPANIEGALISGEVIPPVRGVSGERVFVRFENCNFDTRFGSDDYRYTYIAQPRQRGVWAFQRSDFNGLDLRRALELRSGPSDLKEVIVLIF